MVGGILIEAGIILYDIYDEATKLPMLATYDKIIRRLQSDPNLYAEYIEDTYHRNTIEDIEKFASGGNKSDIWTPLNWRAIIPLYIQGYDREIIAKMVSLEPWNTLRRKAIRTKQGENYRRNMKILNVDDFIHFYEATQLKQNNYYEGQHYGFDEQEKQGKFKECERTFQEVLTSMEQGRWSPTREAPQFNFEHFQLLNR